MINSYQIGAKSNFIIELKDFIGPLTVLMELIQKKKIDIYEISLSSIIKDFLKYLKKNKENILEELSGFLYVAALMLELKAKSLIPSRNTEEADTENEISLEVLKQRENEYKSFREISDYFLELIENESIYLVREAPLEEQFFGFFPKSLKTSS